MRKTKTPNKENNLLKVWLPYESMNRRSWVRFSSGFTQQFGKDYERDSFRVMVTAADWYLIKKEYK